MYLLYSLFIEVPNWVSTQIYGADKMKQLLNVQSCLSFLKKKINKEKKDEIWTESPFSMTIKQWYEDLKLPQVVSCRVGNEYSSALLSKR